MRLTPKMDRALHVLDLLGRTTERILVAHNLHPSTLRALERRGLAVSETWGPDLDRYRTWRRA